MELSNFEEKKDQELRQIYKEIKVDFSDLILNSFPSSPLDLFF